METENFSDLFDMADEREGQDDESESVTITSANNPRSYKCPDCDLSFPSSDSMRNHKKAKHLMHFDLKTREGRLLTTLSRDPATRLFTCRCGSKFESSTNGYHHRKSYSRTRLLNVFETKSKNIGTSDLPKQLSDLS